ncbi:sigma-70 family RNA polymerase sigma factor [Geodermatophilus obscurus]|uniref:sigma-70 family RNA polymerase sigma factor n=1 Tax=Geodermatophilus obscurus TaxID=1861 RepID=UPI001AA18099|nr:sigma-70 family RNA polymerase sigma factor [Geodermatophilus obscurus]
MTARERLLDELRPGAFALAYRMLGSVSDAEDVVQEALLRVHQALDAGEQIASPRAFVATATTRLAINQLRSARARRERYVGEWLPEPIITDGRDDPARHAETADSLSLAMLVLLESLSPEQRAVLLLHDVFDYGYPESQGSSARARTTSASSPPAPDATSSSAGRASKPRASSATSWQPGSSRPPSTATSRGSRHCSRTTWH